MSGPTGGFAGGWPRKNQTKTGLRSRRSRHKSGGAPSASAPKIRLYGAPVNPGATVHPDQRDGIAIVGRFRTWPWGQHPDESYLADALESLSVRVYRVPQDEPSPVLHQAEWALFTGHPCSLSRLSQWRHSHPTVLWTLDWLPDYPERQPIIEAAKRTTLFVSSDQFDWPKLGVTNQGYLPGGCEDQTASFNPQPSIPCAFVGTLYSDRRKKIADIVVRAGGKVLETSEQWIYGEALSKFVQSVKVVVGDNVRNDVPGYWSTRNYIIPGAGGFLLTPRVPGLDKQFKVGEHLAVYDTVEQLPGELDRWLRDDDEREKVRRDGHAHARLNHNWEVRAKSLLVHLAGKIHVSR
jgi:hypothetical protein